MKKRFSRLFIAILTLVVIGVVTTGCNDVATTSASCAFLVNDKDTDKSIDNVIYPGQSGNKGDEKTIRYFPCNSRTYGTSARHCGNRRHQRHAPRAGRDRAGEVE